MNDYPPAWLSGEIQQEMYKRADWRCEHCQMEFIPGSTLAKTARRKDGKPFTLTVHHLNGDKSNCNWRNLLVCCQRCHLYVQARWIPGGVLPATWKTAPNWIIIRNLSYRLFDYVQLGLFE